MPTVDTSRVDPGKSKGSAANRAGTPQWDALWDLPENRAFASGPSFRHKLRLVQRAFDEFHLHGSVLDVACGTGELLDSLPKTIQQKMGIDMSGVAIERAQKRCPTVRFLQHNIEEGALSETFDIMLCTNALEEMVDDHAALTHMIHMLAPNGYLLLLTPHRKAYWSEKDVMAGNKRRYEAAELTNILQELGLQVRKTTTWGWPLYRAWYHLMVRVDQKDVWGKPSRGAFARIGATLAYGLLFFDDFFQNSSRGSILFLVAQKKV